jgi:murein DD-endopeptidase MepM/ murein hydrolase activator NlpD
LKNITKIYLQLPKKHQIFITVLSLMIMLLLVVPSEEATASKQNSNNVLEIGQRYELVIPENTATSIPETSTSNISETVKIQKSIQPALQWEDAKVKSGDSLAKIFKRNGFSAKTTHDVSNAQGKFTKRLLKLNVGDIIKIGRDDSGKLISLEYPLSKTETLFVNNTEQGYITKKEIKDVEIRQDFTHGTIKSSFWHAGVEAGLNDNQIINLANIFGWDIDFALDIREGDTFHIVYEKQYVDGEFIGTGNILAAEFVNQKDSFQAIRYTDGDYYTADGDSMKKAFLRAPVNFKYISSNFKPKRFHPVQKKWKAHRGTDYAARTGTPVVAAGDGKVTHSTYNQYNGHYVFIQHGNGIVTKYLHFSKRKVKAGQRVKQGQVIGYVGATGLAAGPHLHYEFLLNGVHRNPRTVSLPNAQPIPKKHKAKFSLIAQQQLALLNSAKHTLLAMQLTDEQYE